MKLSIFKFQGPALLIFFLLGLQALNAQVTTTVCKGELVKITLSGYQHGAIQWEQSPNSNQWAPIPGASNDTLSLVADTSGYFRALVTSPHCPALYSDTTWLIVSPLPVADAGRDTALCGTDSVRLGGAPSGTGGQGPYTYLWEPPLGLSGSTIPNPMASTPNTVIYVLVVTDQLGCQDFDTVIVTRNAGVLVNAGPDSTLGCGDSITLGGNPTASGGSGNFTYFWSPAAGLNNPSVANPVAIPQTTTSYTLTVVDNNGCTGKDSVKITAPAGTNTLTFNFTGQIDNFTVPATCSGSLTIEVWGAEGSFNPSSTIQPGFGAYAKGDFVIPPGTILKILVGERPSINTNGGGGGSFVSDNNNVPLICAGGGSGSSESTDGPQKHGQTTNSGGNGTAGGGLGGSNGNGGAIGGGTFQSGAGGGFLTNGADGWTTNTGGKAFINGGAGGNAGFGVGGFGGGGNGSGYVVGGAGGGYSGGGSGGNNIGGVAGGGGSFNAGTNQTMTGGIRSGSGQVIISW